VVRRLQGLDATTTFARMTPRPHLGDRVMAASASLSLERKLPLLISVLLAALAVGLTAAGYHEVKQASEARGIARLQRLTSQLAELSGTTTQQRFAAMRRVASDSAVVAYLLGAESDTASRARAIAALRGLSISATDTTVVAELRPTSEAVRVATTPEVPGDEEEPVAALSDMVRLHQEFQVPLSSHCTEPDTLRFYPEVEGTVGDTGIGIAPDDLDKALEPLLGPGQYVANAAYTDIYLEKAALKRMKKDPAVTSARPRSMLPAVNL